MSGVAGNWVSLMQYEKVILITGVSSGFGKEAAVLMAQAGYTVYGTVRKTVKPLQGVIYSIWI